MGFIESIGGQTKGKKIYFGCASFLSKQTRTHTKLKVTPLFDFPSLF